MCCVCPLINLGGSLPQLSFYFLLGVVPISANHENSFFDLEKTGKCCSQPFSVWALVRRETIVSPFRFSKVHLFAVTWCSIRVETSVNYRLFFSRCLLVNKCCPFPFQFLTILYLSLTLTKMAFFVIVRRFMPTNISPRLFQLFLDM